MARKKLKAVHVVQFKDTKTGGTVYEGYISKFAAKSRVHFIAEAGKGKYPSRFIIPIMDANSEGTNA